MPSFNSSIAIALAFTLPHAISGMTDDQLELTAGLSTFDDGRAPIQQLYRAYGALLDQGWTMDVIIRSQPPGTTEALPIFALRTPATGPAIWIISGVHGEETAGPNALARSIERIAETGERQPVVLIPLANPQGYTRNWRYLNTPVWSEDVDGQSVGDSSHLLIDLEKAPQPRAPSASSPEADAITRYVLESMGDYPPIISLDLHEDDEIDEGYVYSQGALGANEPLARLAVEALLRSGVPIKMDGQTRFEEVIQEGIIGPVVDSSIDELMSAEEIATGGSTSNGPAAPVVLVIETPRLSLPFEVRVAAQAAVLKALLGSEKLQSAARQNRSQESGGEY